MPIERLTGTNLSYYLIAFDADGRERADDPDGKMSEVIATAVANEPITDVFLMSHGWKGDIPAAREQYGNWIRAMAACTDDIARVRRSRPDFMALIVGFHWPSQPWGDEEFGAAAGNSFSTSGAVSANGTEILKQFIDLYSDRLVDTPAARRALETIFRAASQNIAPTQLPPDVIDAYEDLDRELNLDARGEDGAPGADRDAFNPQRSYSAAKALGGADFGSPVIGGLLSPLRQLSFWKMKDRALRLGESAGFNLLRSMQNAVPRERSVRFHLMGHSFGCIVVSAMLRGESKLPHPIDSLALIQGALSLWSYCSDIPKQLGTSGYFRAIIAGEAVTGPIITTQSSFDTAVGRFYPLGASARGDVIFDVPAAGQPVQVDRLPKFGGVGTFGIQGPGLQIVPRSMAPLTEGYRFEPHKIYNIESSRYICNGSGASGAHSDIAKPEVAHAMWSAACSN